MPSQPKKANPKSAAKPNVVNPYRATSWARELVTDLECPSGQLCQVRVPGVQGLIKGGLIDSLDSLTSLVQTEHMDRMKTGESSTITPEAMASLSQNADALKTSLDLMDRVVLHVVLQPELLQTPEDDKDRIPGAAYVDAVDLQDKVYIFQFVMGGVRDLETFRQEFGETLGSVEALSGLPSSGE